eukprot:2016982-Amphidinium_carterae.1
MIVIEARGFGFASSNHIKAAHRYEAARQSKLHSRLQSIQNWLEGHRRTFLKESLTACVANAGNRT